MISQVFIVSMMAFVSTYASKPITISNFLIDTNNGLIEIG